MYWVSVGTKLTSLCHISISLYCNNTVKITADILLNGVEELTKNTNRGREGKYLRQATRRRLAAAPVDCKGGVGCCGLLLLLLSFRSLRILFSLFSLLLYYFSSLSLSCSLLLPFLLCPCLSFTLEYCSLKPCKSFSCFWAWTHHNFITRGPCYGST